MIPYNKNLFNIIYCNIRDKVLLNIQNIDSFFAYLIKK